MTLRALLSTPLLSSLLLLLALVGGVPAAYADRVDDMRAANTPPEAYCTAVAQLRVYGAMTRLEGRPMHFKIISPKDLEALGPDGKTPRDAIYLVADENTTQQEIEFGKAEIVVGYAKMHNWLADHPEVTIESPEQFNWQAVARTFYGDCRREVNPSE